MSSFQFVHAGVKLLGCRGNLGEPNQKLYGTRIFQLEKCGTNWKHGDPNENERNSFEIVNGKKLEIILEIGRFVKFDYSNLTLKFEIVQL